MKPIDETIKSWGACCSGSETWHVADYRTWWGAALEFFAQERNPGEATDPDDECEVWEEADPHPPEDHISVERLIDDLRCEGSDDYEIDVGDGYLDEVTTPQEEELEAAVRKVVGEWLDRHKLRPTWKVGRRSWVVTYQQAKEREQRAKEGGDV